MELSQIKRVAVIGSGIMGHGIGQAFALGGYDVTLNDLTDELLKKALGQIAKNLQTFAEFEITTSAGAAEALSRIRMATDLEEAVEGADFIVEALPSLRPKAIRI